MNQPIHAAVLWMAVGVVTRGVPDDANGHVARLERGANRLPYPAVEQRRRALAE